MINVRDERTDSESDYLYFRHVTRHATKYRQIKSEVIS